MEAERKKAPEGTGSTNARNQAGEVSITNNYENAEAGGPEGYPMFNGHLKAILKRIKEAMER